MSMQVLADTYADIAEAARVLGACPETVKRRIRGGDLRGIRFGNKWLIERSELERFRATYRGRPGSPTVNGAYLSGQQAAYMAGCWPTTVYRAIRNGELEAMTRPASYLIERSAAERWIAREVGDGYGTGDAAGHGAD